jgi:putative ABC transport system permease protein
MSVLWRKLGRDLLHIRGQVLAVTLVAACGVAVFTAMRGAYNALLETQQRYYAAYRFADIFAGVKRAPQRVSAAIADIEGVAPAQTRVVVEAKLLIPGFDEPATGRFLSLPDAGRPLLNDVHLRRGRYLEPGARDEVLVGEAFAEAHGLRPGDTVTAILNGRLRRLRVAGIALSPEFVYAVGGRASILPDDLRFGIFWMGRDALSSAYDLHGAFNDVAVRLAPGARPEAVMEQLDVLLERYGTLGAYARADQESHKFLENELRELRGRTVFDPFLFLGVAAFLVHLVVSRLVAGQREQIAAMKAFGFADAVIGAHYLLLAITMLLPGLVLGIALGIRLGMAIATLYSDYYRFPELHYTAGPDVIVMAAALTLAAGVVAAWSSVRQALRLPPAEAMRPPAPPAFHAGWLERMDLRRLLSPAWRMVLRSLARHPVKAALSSLGIALGVGILVLGGFMFDAIAVMIEVQFRRIQRDDLTVTFLEPRSRAALHSVRALPGTLQAEPFRVAPVRISFEHRSRRTALFGVEPEPQLRRLLDVAQRPFAVPPEGLVLSAVLAESLRVRPGDEVWLEVLEGTRPRLSLPVKAIFDEYMGSSAYMDMAAMNRLLAEGERISGVYLLADGDALPGLLARLREAPHVAGVSARRSVIQSFEETIARSLNVVSFVLVGFAAVIAFGIVYNSVRVALAERGRDFASLRVLGFTVPEVRLMLLGEQAVLTLAAIPLGLLLGYGMCLLTISFVDNELMKLPLVIEGRSYARAALVTLAVAAVSAVLVSRRVARLDLVEVLKTRE